MPGVLFQLPKVIAFDQGVAQAGATLTFSQTGTATPQNIYTNAALTVAHSNPVTADSEGVFAPIFLDSSLVDYRVVFKDTAGATVYTVDDIPAGVEVARNFTLEGTAPYLLLTETDASANNKNYRLIATSEQLLVQLGNDALDTWTTVISIDRTANTLDAITVNGVDMTPASGTFTASFDNAGTTTPTITFDYQRIGNIVLLFAASSSGFPITGDSTAFATTGTPVPAALRPAASIGSPLLGGFLDGGGAVRGTISVTSAGNVAFFKEDLTSWTASGSRTATAGFTFAYMLGNP